MKSQLKARVFSFIAILSMLLGALGIPAQNVLAAGTTYYVDSTVTCDDGGSGTTILPFCTIGQGASVAVAGDTVQVLAGTYAETVSGMNSGSAGSPITFSAASGVTVSGDGTANGGSAFRISGESYIVVDGFTVTGTADYGIYVFSSDHITISNNQVSSSGSPASGSTRMGIYINSTTDSTISGNTTNDNSSHGILLTNGSGQQPGQRQPRFRQCRRVAAQCQRNSTRRQQRQYDLA